LKLLVQSVAVLALYLNHAVYICGMNPHCIQLCNISVSWH